MPIGEKGRNYPLPSTAVPQAAPFTMPPSERAHLVFLLYARMKGIVITTQENAQ